MNPVTLNDLPSLDPNQVRLTQLTSGAGRAIPLRFGNDLWKLACTGAHMPWTPEIFLPLAIDGEPCGLELSFSPGGKLFERHAEFRDIESMSAPFALAIRATLSRELLDSIQTALDAPVELAQPSTAKPPYAFSFDIFEASAREGRGTLRIGPKTLARIESVAPSWESMANPDMDNIRLPVAICVASLDVPAAELSAMVLGDCLVVGDVTAWPFSVLISTGEGAIPISARPSAPVPPLLNNSQFNAMNTSESQPSPVDGLRLPVLVVAGRKALTLQEIANLREGTSIEIGAGNEIPVEIEVHNQTIARGRLVRVGDKICADITEVFSGTHK